MDGFTRRKTGSQNNNGANGGGKCPKPSNDMTIIEHRFGVSRREFLTFCTAIAATMGLPACAAAQVAEAITKEGAALRNLAPSSGMHRMHKSLLRAEHPTLEKLILDIISLDYHETLFAAAGHQIEAAKRDAMEKNKGKYLLVVEGAIPMKDGGIYCKIGGRTSLELDARGGSRMLRPSLPSVPAPPGAACLPRRRIPPAASESPRRWAAPTF